VWYYNFTITFCYQLSGWTSLLDHKPSYFWHLILTSTLNVINIRSTFFSTNLYLSYRRDGFLIHFDWCFMLLSLLFSWYPAFQLVSYVCWWTLLWRINFNMHWQLIKIKFNRSINLSCLWLFWYIFFINVFN
jgi:hypothetical protein